jgi:Uma2 family endonuclease
MATAPTLDRTYTPEELLALEDGTKYELIDGIPVERHVSRESSRTNVRFAIVIAQFVLAEGLGEIYDAEVQVRAFRWNPSLVRKPDLAFVDRSRAQPGDSGYLEIAPDWVLETVSPNDGVQEVREKVEMWLRAGVRMVWVAYPPQREITVYRPGARPQLLTADDEISGEDVIPGFQCPVADLFPAPITAPA